MTNPSPPKTLLRQITRFVGSALQLKPNTRVPELWVQEAGASRATIYPLLGDRHLLGRSSQSCDVVVASPVVSQVHLSLNRDSKRKRTFRLKDEGSTNGVYLGKRRINSFPLRHGDVLTLGPPELAQAVKLRYVFPPPWYVLAWRYFLYGMGGIVALLVMIITIESSKFPVRPLPVGVQGPVVIYSRDGQTPLRPLQNQTHTEFRNLSDYSPYLPQAVIASEDSRFYWHFGVDPLGIARAVVTNFRQGELREGASTLTQQLARSLFPETVGREDTAGRKWREAVVALKLETFYSKDQLLLTYLNKVYTGLGNYGFEDASRFYYDKSAKDLSIAEAAALVAILPAPNSYNPIRNYETTVQLRDRVINRMANLRMISDEEANRARRSRIEVSPKAREALAQIKAPYFYSYIFEELKQVLGEELAREGNFLVESTVDLTAQNLAESSLKNLVAQEGDSLRVSQGAIATLNTTNGDILALVGGVDYLETQFDRATQAERQPGSTFKVFAYLSALEQGISPSKSYSCSPLTWEGQNYRGCERSSGSINMYQAIAQSENSVALRVAQDAGLDKVIQLAQRMGITSKLRPNPGLILGESEVNLLEMTAAFGSLGNQGIWNRGHGIRRVIDSGDCKDFNNLQTCRVIYDYEQQSSRNIKVIDPQVASTMTDLLQGVIQSGTGRRAAIGRGEAGKTGTTNDYVDLWFIGYIPQQQIATGIWLGNDDNTPTRGSSGVAAQVWSNYMGQLKS